MEQRTLTPLIYETVARGVKGVGRFECDWGIMFVLTQSNGVSATKSHI